MVVIWFCIVLGYGSYKFSKSVSDEWAMKRADELVDGSYDFHHIENIRKRRTASQNIDLN